MERNQLFSITIVAVVALIAIILMVNMGSSSISSSSSENLVTGNMVKEGKYYTNKISYEDVFYIKRPGDKVAKARFEPKDSAVNIFRQKQYEIHYLGFLDESCVFEISQLSPYGTERISTEQVGLKRGEETQVYGFNFKVFSTTHSFQHRGDYDCQVEFQTD